MGQTLGGYPARSSQGGRGTLAGGYPGGGYPGQGGILAGGYPGGGYPGGWYPGMVPPRPGQDGGRGGNPVRTTEGVVTTRQAVCLLRSRRRTFLLMYLFNPFPIFNVNDLIRGIGRYTSYHLLKELWLIHTLCFFLNAIAICFCL